MKRNQYGLLILLAVALALSGTAAAANIAVKVGAAVVPHAEILEFVKPELKKAGIDLQIVVLDDEGQLNPALADRQIDANYFQHVPYLDSVSKEKGYRFTVAGKIHRAHRLLFPKDQVQKRLEARRQDRHSQQSLQ